MIKTLIEEHVDKCLASQQQDELRSKQHEIHNDLLDEKKEREVDGKNALHSENPSIKEMVDRRPLAERVRPGLFDEMAVLPVLSYNE